MPGQITERLQGIFTQTGRRNQRARDTPGNKESFRDANIAHFIRTINGFGCVQIDNEEWFVTPDEHYKHAKVKIYRPQNHDGDVKYIAELETTFI